MDELGPEKNAPAFPGESRNQATVAQTRTIYRGRTFSLVTEEVFLPNGSSTSIPFVRHPGSTAIIPLFGDGSVAMIRQYRHPVGEYLFEIPAGTMEPGETPIACARRELEEETGFKAGEFFELLRTHILPAYTDEVIYVFAAMDLHFSGQRLDQDEIIDVVKVPLGRVLDMIDSGAVTDALTILSIHRALKFLENSGKWPKKRFLGE